MSKKYQIMFLKQLNMILYKNTHNINVPNIKILKMLLFIPNVLYNTKLYNRYY